MKEFHKADNAALEGAFCSLHSNVLLPICEAFLS